MHVKLQWGLKCRTSKLRTRYIAERFDAQIWDGPFKKWTIKMAVSLDRFIYFFNNNIKRSKLTKLSFHMIRTITEHKHPKTKTAVVKFECTWMPVWVVVSIGIGRWIIVQLRLDVGLSWQLVSWVIWSIGKTDVTINLVRINRLIWWIYELIRRNKLVLRRLKLIWWNVETCRHLVCWGIFETERKMNFKVS